MTQVIFRGIATKRGQTLTFETPGGKKYYNYKEVEAALIHKKPTGLDKSYWESQSWFSGTQKTFLMKSLGLI